MLEAEEDMTNYFTGITFSGIPDGIKLMSDDNGTINRTKTRKYTLNDNSDAITEEQKERGIAWVKKITRLILPFNNFTPVDDATKAFELTIDMNGRNSLSCKLKSETESVNGDTKNNYTLPLNSRLSLTGVIKVINESDIAHEEEERISRNGDNDSDTVRNAYVSTQEGKTQKIKFHITRAAIRHE